MSFRVDFFHLVYASRVQRIVEKRKQNTRYHEIRIQKSVGKKEHWTLDILCFHRFQNPATKDGSLAVLSLAKPSAHVIQNTFIYFFYSFIYRMISVYLIYSKFCSRLEEHFKFHIVPLQIEHPLHS